MWHCDIEYSIILHFGDTKNLNIMADIPQMKISDAFLCQKMFI